VEYVGPVRDRQTSDFCSFFHLYSVIGWPEKVHICCGGQAEQKNATTSGALRRNNFTPTMGKVWAYFCVERAKVISITAFKEKIRKFLKVLVVHRLDLINPLIFLTK
jgi:hypothetical protein